MTKKRISSGGRLSAQLPTQEELLFDLARSLRLHRKGRHAIHVHLSRLSPDHLHTHALRQAVEALGPVIRKYEGRLFRLVNHDIVLVAKDVGFAALDEAVLRIRGIFRDDPAYRRLDDGRRDSNGSDAFCTFYDIEQAADAFLATAQRMLDAQQGDNAPASVIPFAPTLPRATQNPQRDQSERPVSGLERHIDIRTVSALSRDGLATPILSELHFRPESLRSDSLRPPAQNAQTLPGDRWLLQMLTATLDNAIITGQLTQRPLPTAFCLPLLSGTVQSTEFQDFIDHYRQLSRHGLVFEFAAADVLRDPAQFLAARDRIIDLGHRICITGWDPHLFALLNAIQLEVHFHKISWTPLLNSGFRSDWADELRQNVRRTGATKVILSDCNSAEALAFGQRHGLLLFQGPHLEPGPGE